MLFRSKRLYLQGGFGNVLFQFAIVRYCQRESNVVVVDSLTKRNWITKALGWKIHDPSYTQIAKELGITVCSESTGATIFNASLSKLSQIMGRPVCGVYFYKENAGLRFIERSNVLFGYYQDKTILTRCQNEVLEISNTLKRLYLKTSKSENTIVHFRYGDSVWARRFYSYYEQSRRFIVDASFVIVVTDSQEKALKEYSNNGAQRYSIQSGTILEDFSVLLGANRLICAPSTFSWWASQSLRSASKVLIDRATFDKLGNYREDITFTVL